MQNAKDSFYEVLRGRLAALNPERTVNVRGITRPGLVVDENETESVAALPDCFHMRWTKQSVADEGPMPLVTLTCEIGYAGAGTAMNGGLDRGRALAGMDAELSAALGQQPQNAVKSDYSALAHGGAVVAMKARIWWGGLTFSEAKLAGDRVARTAEVQVMCFQEEGEL